MKAASVIVALSAAVAGFASAAAPAQASTQKVYGCPGGYVCMYTWDGWLNSTPEHTYYSYGYHALSNEYGERVVFNNQYATSAGRPGAYLCTSNVASSCTTLIKMDTPWDTNISPINYIRLTPSGG